MIMNVAEEKTRAIVDITHELKRSAVDCRLFHEVNSYPQSA